MQQSVRELAVTTAAMVAIVLTLFVALRLAFPDPPIAGQACPASLDTFEFTECIRSWHESNRARDEHHLRTMLTIVLGTVGVGIVLARSMRVRLPGFRLGLALTAASGFFAMLAAVQFATDDNGSGYAIGAGLFALAALIDGERHPRSALALAAIVGAVLLFGAWLVAFTWFYRGSGAGASKPPVMMVVYV